MSSPTPLAGSVSVAYLQGLLDYLGRQGLDPAAYPPEPNYIRDADAKPQEKFKVARQ